MSNGNGFDSFFCLIYSSAEIKSALFDIRLFEETLLDKATELENIKD